MYTIFWQERRTFKDDAKLEMDVYEIAHLQTSIKIRFSTWRQHLLNEYYVLLVTKKRVAIATDLRINLLGALDLRVHEFMA